ncbi:MAG: L,D-transpeptidase family protein [Bacillota bacterium]
MQRKIIVWSFITGLIVVSTVTAVELPCGYHLPVETTVEVSSDHLQPPQGEVFLLIDGYAKVMKVYDDDKLHHEFPVAVGKPSTKSPVGEWAIIAKDAHWGGGFGVRWMRLNVPWGIYGIHGTNKPGSIGTAASHGCIRMFNRHVKVLYSWVDVGTRVKIIGDRDSIKITHTLQPGQTGKDVLLFQERLRKYGFDPGYTDGRFGSTTKEAVKELRALYGLGDELVGDENIFYLLNLR